MSTIATGAVSMSGPAPLPNVVELLGLIDDEPSIEVMGTAPR